MRELEHYRRDLETLTSLVSQNLQEPLRTVTRSCQTLGEKYCDTLDPEAEMLSRSALTAVEEVQRLVDDLLEHCRTKGPESSAGQSPAGIEAAGSVTDGLRPSATVVQRETNTTIP